VRKAAGEAGGARVWMGIVVEHTHTPAEFAREFQVLSRVKSDFVRVERAEVPERLGAVHARVRPVVVVNALVCSHEALLLKPLREERRREEVFVVSARIRKLEKDKIAIWAIS